MKKDARYMEAVARAAKMVIASKCQYCSLGSVRMGNPRKGDMGEAKVKFKIRPTKGKPYSFLQATLIRDQVQVALAPVIALDVYFNALDTQDPTLLKIIEDGIDKACLIRQEVDVRNGIKIDKNWDYVEDAVSWGESVKYFLEHLLYKSAIFTLANKLMECGSLSGRNVLKIIHDNKLNHEEICELENMVFCENSSWMSEGANA